MTRITVGLTFSETMAGAFALGETDPEAGRARARSQGYRFAMHGTIEIENLDGFIADPQHQGNLQGTIDFTPLGDQISAPRGRFALFAPTEDPDLKLMIYELGFEHEGREYYMAGKKEVRRASIFAMWRATTTLYTQLHQGADKAAPVIGAGVLRLGVPQLAGLVATLHATNAANWRGDVAARMRFARFFAAELWDTYVRPGRRNVAVDS